MLTITVEVGLHGRKIDEALTDESTEDKIPNWTLLNIVSAVRDNRQRAAQDSAKGAQA